MLVFDTEPYKTRSSFSGNMIEKKVIGVVEKTDELGVILDPCNLDFKCGWGVTLSDAKEHFIKRNPNVLCCQD
jgi:hypothetical protein